MQTKFRFLGSALGAALLVTSACTALVNTDIAGSGLGAACGPDGACHASQCVDDVCVVTCGAKSECPDGFGCSNKNVCMPKLKVSAFYVGVVADGEGWSLTHDQGLKSAAKQLGYVELDTHEAVFDDKALG